MAIFSNFLTNYPVASALWFRSAKNQDVSNGPLDCPLACLLTPLTHSLALHCLLRTACFAQALYCALLHSLVWSLAHFAHSQACGKVYSLMSQYHLVFNYSVVVVKLKFVIMNKSFCVIFFVPQYQSVCHFTLVDICNGFWTSVTRPKLAGKN